MCLTSTATVTTTATAAASGLAWSFNSLLAFRLLQGLASGVCVVLPLAIIRDLFEGAGARTRLSQIVSVIGIAPTHMLVLCLAWSKIDV